MISGDAIAEWSGGEWFFCGSEVGYSQGEVEEILSGPIPHPYDAAEASKE